MVAATLMWSIAGVVTRHLEAARSFEVTFWRSAFAALCMALLLWWLRGAAPLWRVLRQGGLTLWISGACWCVMFTAFMLALTLTSVANVLITMALGPLFTALLSRVVLRHALPWRTWVAIAMAGAGITWMYGDQFTPVAPSTCGARWPRWPCRWPRPSTGPCCTTTATTPRWTCCPRC